MSNSTSSLVRLLLILVLSLAPACQSISVSSSHSSTATELLLKNNEDVPDQTEKNTQRDSLSGRNSSSEIKVNYGGDVSEASLSESFSASASFRYPLTMLPSSYTYSVASLVDSAPYDLVVDTGSPSIFIEQPFSEIFNDTSLADRSMESGCLYLGLDGTEANWTGVNKHSLNYEHSCLLVLPDGNQTTMKGTGISLMNADGVLTSELYSPYKAAERFQAENIQLHNWLPSGGVLGMSYCHSSDPNREACFAKSGFSEIAGTPSTSSLFGIDLNAQDQESFLDIGGLSPTYEPALVWTTQAETTPIYHSFMMEDLSVCGINLFGNWSSTWRTMVDTGSTCLTLPAELHDTLSAWLDLSLQQQGQSLENLPFLSFALTDTDDPKMSEERMYIRLYDLLVNSSDIVSEPVVASELLTVMGRSLCVLRGDNIVVKNSDMLNNVPISMGSLALRSLYFAANFHTFQVGLANKVSQSELSAQKPQFREGITDEAYNKAVGFCRAASICVGEESFATSKNACKPPRCGSYLFTEYDESQHKCRFVPGYVTTGAIILTCIIFAEITSFFSNKYTAYETLGIKALKPIPVSLSKLYATSTESSQASSNTQSPTTTTANANNNNNNSDNNNGINGVTCGVGNGQPSNSQPVTAENYSRSAEGGDLLSNLPLPADHFTIFLGRYFARLVDLTAGVVFGARLEQRALPAAARAATAVALMRDQDGQNVGNNNSSIQQQHHHQQQQHAISL